MNTRSGKRWIIALVVLLTALPIFWLCKSEFLSKEPATKGTSVKNSPSLASQKNYQTNQPPLFAANNPSTATNSTTTISTGAGTTNINDDGQISASALKQIAALERAKASRTPVEQKIDSQLLYADMMQRGIPIADGVPTQRVDLDKDEQGRILVDIKADVTDALLQYIRQNLGGNVVNDFPQYQAIRASVPLTNIEVLAARSDVKFIEPAVRVMVNNVDSQGDYTHQNA
jgi:hypothetical protein